MPNTNKETFLSVKSIAIANIFDSARFVKSTKGFIEFPFTLLHFALTTELITLKQAANILVGLNRLFQKS